MLLRVTVKFLGLVVCALSMQVVPAQLPGGPGLGSGGSSPGNWEHSEIEGFPKYSYTLSANPVNYDWEGSYPNPGGDDGETTDEGFGAQQTPTNGQLLFSASDARVHANSQANISVSGLSSDEIDLKTVSSAAFSKMWEFVGDPTGAKPVNFGGSASIKWDLSCQGSTGYDSGYFADPAYSTATAGFSGGWSVSSPFDFNANEGLSIVGKSDNQASNSSVDTITLGGGTAGPIKIFGVLIDLNEPPTQNTGLNFLGSSKGQASESIGAMEVTGPGSITYSWDVSVSAATDLTTFSNSATATADALAGVSMSFGIVPKAGNQQGTVGP